MGGTTLKWSQTLENPLYDLISSLETCACGAIYVTLLLIVYLSTLSK